ncbi:hypothetical protein Tco_0228271 [Tanacetum coccineum]
MRSQEEPATNERSIWSSILPLFLKLQNTGAKKIRKELKSILLLLLLLNISLSFIMFQMLNLSRRQSNQVSKEDINQKFLRSLPPSWSQIALIMRNKPDIDQTDIDDLYNNLRVYEDEMKRCDEVELDIRWQVAMLTVRVQRFIKKTGRNLDFKGKQPCLPLISHKLSATTVTDKGTLLRNANHRWNQGKRSYGDNGRRNATTNEPSSQALGLKMV